MKSVKEALEDLVEAVYAERDHHPTDTWVALHSAESALKASDSET